MKTITMKKLQGMLAEFVENGCNIQIEVYETPDDFLKDLDDLIQRNGD